MRRTEERNWRRPAWRCGRGLGAVQADGRGRSGAFRSKKWSEILEKWKGFLKGLAKGREGERRGGLWLR